MDVDAIMATIREEARGRREAQGARTPALASIRAAIAEASHNADAGERVTPMAEFSGPKRWLALRVGRMIVYLLSFITVRQRLFNAAVLDALTLQAEALEDQERRIAELRAELARLRAGAGREAGDRD
jgi:hypothetical protein